MRSWLVSLVIAGGLAALAWGPATYVRDHGVTTRSILEVRLASPADGQWESSPPGVVDTARQVPGASDRPAPTLRRISYAVAARDARRPGTISVTGAPAGSRSRGVGAVVVESDVDALAALPEPERTRAVREIVAGDGLALSVFALEHPPSPGAERLLPADLAGREDVARRFPVLRKLIAVWAQLRSAMTVIVPPADDDTAPVAHSTLTPAVEPGSSSWRRQVAEAVHREILPALREGRPIVSAALLAQVPDGLLQISDGRVEVTARGAAYGVASRAIQPGSRLVPSRVTGSGLVARVFARADGRGSLLVWNPGPARVVRLQVPDGRRVVQYRLRVAGRALASAVIVAP